MDDIEISDLEVETKNGTKVYCGSPRALYSGKYMIPLFEKDQFSRFGNVAEWLPLSATIEEQEEAIHANVDELDKSIDS